jgi:eukaryotic-like serine/threonine-protein kinase
MIAITLEWIQAQFPGLSNLALIAEGGQKWVLRAVHCTDGSVVLKLIKPSGDAGARIQREILAVKQVASARVPKMREVGSLATDAGPLVWVREDLVAGASVRQSL